MSSRHIPKVIACDAMTAGKVTYSLPCSDRVHDRTGKNPDHDPHYRG